MNKAYIGFYTVTMLVAPWCSGYYYCTTLLNEALTQVLRRFKSSWRRVGDLRRWGSLTMVRLEIKLNAFRWSTIPQKQKQFRPKRVLDLSFLFTSENIASGYSFCHPEDCFFLLNACFKILTRKSVISPINWNIQKKHHSKY